MARSKKRDYQIIPGDPVSREEIMRQLYQHRLSMYQFEMEKVRVDAQLTSDEKARRRNTLMIRIKELKDSYQREW